AVPLACADGRFALEMPGVVDADATAAEVRVGWTGATGGERPVDWEIAGHRTMVDRAGAPARLHRGEFVRAPAQAPWRVSFNVPIRAHMGDVDRLPLSAL